MQRYILDEITNDFTKDDIHHIKHVMRFKTGDNVIICKNNKCMKVELIIDNFVRYNEINEILLEEEIDITVIQGLLKGSKIETTIKYGTIFGASSFILTAFNRSIAKAKNEESKLIRYHKIAKEATELSHRSKVANISFSESLEKIDYTNFDYVFLADEEEINKIDSKLNSESLKKSKVAIIIGPEGGISDSERKFLKTRGVISISLGKYIFPAEIAAISLLNYFNH